MLRGSRFTFVGADCFPASSVSDVSAGVTQVTCTGNQFAEIIETQFLKLKKSCSPYRRFHALTRGVWRFLEALWTRPPSVL
ncbi:single-pass membrane and coiled-coil domain-containing protein 4 isoform X1 [Lemur catta]|uniref:single-pass membrane and coiled-coil domain-containing protein 4 isoform X1 n=1 Tax=Lemur catta TaxID=9447 RepID=UPI001E267D57|nr:single-pass membrane and coiled-coil domain-containing protein 4 isoform X1 [Lemur catta]